MSKCLLYCGLILFSSISTKKTNKKRKLKIQRPSLKLIVSGKWPCISFRDILSPSWGLLLYNNNWNKVHLNHPQTIPTHHLCSLETVFCEAGPRCHKGWGPGPAAQHFFTGRPVPFSFSCCSFLFNLPGRQFPNEMPVSPGSANWQNLACV